MARAILNSRLSREATGNQEEEPSKKVQCLLVSHGSLPSLAGPEIYRSVYNLCLGVRDAVREGKVRHDLPFNVPARS